jgi:hypothetical protein
MSFDPSQLRRHVRDFHPDMPMARSNADLSDRHHRHHRQQYRYRSGTGHVQIGAEAPLIDYGIGRGMRPEGWTIGKGAVDRTAYERGLRDKVITRGQDLITCRWRGVNRGGIAQVGMTSLLPASVAGLGERYWRLGWREFLIVPGSGPVPSP